MAILPHEEILSLYTAILSARLGESRSALLACVPTGFVASLPLASSPAEQIIRDLDVLNTTGTLADGSTPLFTWLANAVALAGDRSETAVFERALRRCKMADSPLSADVSRGDTRRLSVTRVALADKRCWEEHRLDLKRKHVLPIPAQCKKHFLLRGNEESDLWLDVTLVSHADESIIINDVGILVVSVSHVVFLFDSGQVTSYDVPKEANYVVRIPDLVSRVMAEDLSWILNKEPRLEDRVQELNQSIWSCIDDPRCLTAGAPFRFSLRLAEYVQNMPNHATLRVLVDTSMGTVESGPFFCTM